MSIKKRIYIIFSAVWSISAVVLLLYYFFMVSPTLNQHNSVKAELQQINSPENKQQSRLKLREQFEKCKDFKQQLADFIIKTDGWIDMMPYVSSIARNEKVSEFSGKDLSANKFEDFEGLKKVGVKTLNVNFEASFLKFARFINRLESGKPVIFVKEFSIERNPDSYQENAVKMELRVIVGKESSQVNKVLAAIELKGSQL